MWTNNPAPWGLLVGWMLCAGLLAAQTQDTAAVFRPMTFVGVQYGNSWNKMNFSPRVEQATLAATRIGLQMRHEGESNLGIQIELARDGRGWTETIDSIASRYTRELEYVDLGLFSHIGIGRGRVKPFVVLGSYLSFPLSDTEILPADWPRTGDYYGQALPKRIQYGLAGGFGLEVILGRVRIQADGRYRSALGGIFATGASNFTFSNNQGATAQVSVLYGL